MAKYYQNCFKFGFENKTGFFIYYEYFLET